MIITVTKAVIYTQKQTGHYLIDRNTCDCSYFLESNLPVVGCSFEGNVQHTEQHDLLLDDLVPVSERGLLVIVLSVRADYQIEIVDLSAVQCVDKIPQPLVGRANEAGEDWSGDHFSEVEYIVPSDGGKRHVRRQDVLGFVTEIINWGVG